MTALSLRRGALLTLCLAVTATPSFAQESESDQGQDTQKQAKKDDPLDLRKIFPEKSFFGPSAGGMAFSQSGRYALYTWRSYEERRHGSDLFLLDVGTGETTRLTSVARMAEHHRSARKALEDRIEHLKKERAKKAKDKDGKKAKVSDEELLKRIAQGAIAKDDAKREKGPRYRGISSFEWSPTHDEFLFSSGGDLFYWKIGEDDPVRVTRTEESERSYDWLPDGNGYTFLRDGDLYRVRFGEHLIEQLNPSFPNGEDLSSYRISPDGNRLVFVTRVGQSTRDVGRTVKIASYRDRFTKVREVPRHVSDDPLPKTTTRVYLYDLEGMLEERGKLIEVHEHEYTGPRDSLQTPEWAPDSSRVTFSFYAQDDDQVRILEAQFPKADDAEETADTNTDGNEDGTSTGSPSGDETKVDLDELTDSESVIEHPAKVVYRFLHAGGPNTPNMIDPRYTADSRHIAYLSEQSGFRHLHLLDPLYEASRQLTYGHFEVYPLELSKDHSTLYALATKEDSSCQDVYAIDLESGKMRRLTTERGFYSSAAVAKDGRTVLANFVRYGQPRELSLTRQGQMTTITESHAEAAKTYTKARPEFVTYKNRHGQEIRAYVHKPEGWSVTDERPALIYVYGGPLGTRKNVVEGSYNSDGYLFGWYMAQKHGYVTAVIDPRGMSGYGASFEKANFEQVGKPQVEDLVDGLKFLDEHYGVDGKRVGLHGWSFGGFQTQMCLYTEPDVFACGIAGAGPTEWENYNSWYSTGTIGESRKGTKEPDLKKYSLLPLAKNLKARLLLVHGMEDSNVLYQDTVRVYRELLKAGKETLVELFLDPTGGHGLGGDIKRFNKARKYEEFFLRNLGKGVAEVEVEEISTESVEASEVGGR